MTATWTQPKTWTNEPLIAGDMNTHLRDNLEALKDPPYDTHTLNEVSDLTTSSTTFVSVDSDFEFTITTFGGPVKCYFRGTVVLNGTVYFDVEVDGVRVAGDDGAVHMTMATTLNLPMSFQIFIDNLDPGSHTFKLMWKVSAGTVTLYSGAGTSAKDTHPQFTVRED